MTRKGLFVVLFLLAVSIRSHAQGGTWTWVRGANNEGSSGNYGVKGVAAATNEPPARYQACYWTDKQGNFWLFGGVMFGGLGNDLWKYDVKTNMWTWVSGPDVIGSPNSYGIYGTKGIPSRNNYPPARGYGANCWTDNNGDLWLYGGFGAFNDLWKYRIATNEWTWVNGSNTTASAVYGTLGVASVNNTPGNIQEVKSAWVDAANNLWMFGGDEMNTIWRYNIAGDTWTWVNGVKVPQPPGNYGTYRTENPANQPPGRFSYTRWKDGAGNMYIFAGGRIASSVNYNDVWRYRPSNNRWTWVSGTNKVNDSGSYPPQMCKFYDNHFPPSRIENQTAFSVNSCAKAFWTFGGITSGSVNLDAFNDLWLFEVDSLKWAWVGGTKQTNHAGIYGTLGVPSAVNVPRGRGGQCMWIDNRNNLWLFGGLTKDGHLNDLWRFVPDTSCIDVGLLSGQAVIPPSIKDCSRDSGVMNIGPHKSVIAKPATGVTYNADSSVIRFNPGTTTSYTVVVVGAGCNPTDTIRSTINRSSVNAAFTLSPKEADSRTPVFQFNNTSSGATSYSWYSKGQPFSTLANPSITVADTGRYCFTLVAKDDQGCSDTAIDCGNVVDYQRMQLFVPSAFSPNGDHVNDVLYVRGTGIVKLDFRVYNRWGKMVFQSDSPDKGWDGRYNSTLQEVDVYSYSLVATMAGGRTVSQTGNVSLLQ